MKIIEIFDILFFYVKSLKSEYLTLITHLISFQVLNSPRGWGFPYWAAWVTESETRPCADGNHNGGFHLSRPDPPPSSPGCPRCVGALKISVTLQGACWQPAGPCLLWKCHSWLWRPSDVRTSCLERRPRGRGCFSEIDTSVYLPGCQNTGSACCQPPPGGLWSPEDPGHGL